VTLLLAVRSPSSFTEGAELKAKERASRYHIFIDPPEFGQLGQESNLHPAVLEVAALRPRQSRSVPFRPIALLPFLLPRHESRQSNVPPLICCNGGFAPFRQMALQEELNLLRSALSGLPAAARRHAILVDDG
jgi:hypothetical protein